MSITLAEEINRLHANICSALADSTRIYILYLLSEGPSNVSSLVEQLELTQPKVSRHLKILRERGLVSAKRQGQSVIYRLKDDRVIESLDLLRAVLANHLEGQASLVDRMSAAP